MSWVRTPPSVPIYVDRSSMVEPRIVIPSVASSNLVDQPFLQFGFTKDTDALNGELSFSPSGDCGCMVRESLSY